MIKTDDYILQNGQHNAIIDEELWNKTQDKRKLTGHKAESKIGRDRAYLLSGILKCPKCGGPMYTNKHAWTNKGGTYKEVYYVCSSIKLERGVKCDYKAMLKKTDIEPLVIEVLREIVDDKSLAEACEFVNDVRPKSRKKSSVRKRSGATSSDRRFSPPSAA